MTLPRFSIVLGTVSVVLLLGITPVIAEQEGSPTARPTTATATVKAQQKATEQALRSQKATDTATRKATTEADRAKTAKTERETNKTDFETARQAKSLAKLQAAGTKAIEHRLKAINEFVAAIGENTCAKASTATKSTVTTSLAASKKNLETQKTNLAAATTYDLAKPIVQAIFTDNRVFAHLLPAAKGLCRADGTLTLLTDRITKAIAALKAEGKDVISLETQLAEAKKAITAAVALYETVLKTPGNSGAKTDLENAVKNTKIAREALTTISQELKKLVSTLEKTN